MFYGIAKFRTRRIRISVCCHPLKRSVLPKVMHECPFSQANMTAHDRSAAKKTYIFSFDAD
jgi:hypothetical protein